MSDQDIARTRRLVDSMETTQARIRAAGQRAATAEATRRAAIDEIGAALRDHRQVRAEEGETGRAWEVPVEDAAELTGISRRTLSSAVTTPPGQSDQELARDAIAYRDESRFSVAELHRRYPELDGLLIARRAWWAAAEREWDEQNPDPSLEDDLFGGAEQPEAVRIVLDAYWQRIRNIAEGRAPGQ